MAEGSAQSFEDFVRASLPALARYAYSLTSNRAEAEDLLQDALLKVSRAWRHIRADGNALGYARTAVLRTYLSAWRGLRRRPRPIPLDNDPGHSAPDAYGQVDARDQLRRALAQLPPAQRAVLVLGYLDDLADDQIAELLDRRPATVRSLRLRGLASLRRHLLEVQPSTGGPMPSGRPNPSDQPTGMPR
jgi:RNA polymerase sigma-70 factor (sigma-E family)